MRRDTHPTCFHRSRAQRRREQGPQPRPTSAEHPGYSRRGEAGGVASAGGGQGVPAGSCDHRGRGRRRTSTRRSSGGLTDLLTLAQYIYIYLTQFSRVVLACLPKVDCGACVPLFMIPSLRRWSKHTHADSIIFTASTSSINVNKWPPYRLAISRQRISICNASLPLPSLHGRRTLRNTHSSSWGYDTLTPWTRRELTNRT